MSLVLLGSGCRLVRWGGERAGQAYRAAPLLKGRPASGLYTEKGQIDVSSSTFDRLYERAHTDSHARDELIAKIMLASDELVERHLAEVQVTQASGNFLFRSTTSTLAGLATILTPTSTTRALAGAAGITNSVHGAFNESALANQLVTAIVDQIQTDRAAWRARVLTGMTRPLPPASDGGKSTLTAPLAATRVNPEPVPPFAGETYSIDQALIDLSNYHRAGSVLHGISRLTAKAPQSSPTTPASDTASAIQILQRHLGELQALRSSLPSSMQVPIDALIAETGKLLTAGAAPSDSTTPPTSPPAPTPAPAPAPTRPAPPADSTADRS